MCRTLILFSILSLISISIDAQTINKEKSVVEFEIQNMYVSTVEGTFSGFSGEVILNKEDLGKSKINVCIDAATVDTGNEKRDKHLRNEDFFNVEKYPKICFTSNNIYTTSAGIEAKGELKMHGITKTVIIPLKQENDVLRGTIQVNRLDYNIAKDTGTFAVGKEVFIVINCYLK